MTIKNKEGLTPLHVAVKEKHEDVCRAILSNRGQVDIEDNNLRGGDKDSASFGLPVADAGENMKSLQILLKLKGDESGDETLSKASAKGAGSDSWGDDTDVSLAEDRKGKTATESEAESDHYYSTIPTEPAKVSLLCL
nr:hypothetical protein BaRGS_025824 [Batillaria attramentaria]